MTKDEILDVIVKTMRQEDISCPLAKEILPCQNCQFYKYTGCIGYYKANILFERLNLEQLCEGDKYGQNTDTGAET